jgi:hypothetical protein
VCVLCVRGCVCVWVCDRRMVKCMCLGGKPRVQAYVTRVVGRHACIVDVVMHGALRVRRVAMRACGDARVRSAHDVRSHSPEADDTLSSARVTQAKAANPSSIGGLRVTRPGLTRVPGAPRPLAPLFTPVVGVTLPLHRHGGVTSGGSACAARCSLPAPPAAAAAAVSARCLLLRACRSHMLVHCAARRPARRLSPSAVRLQLAPPAPLLCRRRRC